MRAEPSEFNYAPVYPYQTPENGSGATLTKQEAENAAKVFKERLAEIEKSVRAMVANAKK